MVDGVIRLLDETGPAPWAFVLRLRLVALLRRLAWEKAAREWSEQPFEVLAAPHDERACPLCLYHRVLGP